MDVKVGGSLVCEATDRTETHEKGQNDTYYITGESFTCVSSSLFLESLRKKGLEVLYTVEQSKKFDGWKLKSVTKDSLDIDDKDERSQRRNLSH